MPPAPFRDHIEYKRIMRDQQQTPISPSEPDLPTPGASPPEAGSASRSLENPDDQQEFARFLFAKIKSKLESKLDDETQLEIAGLARLLSTLPPVAVEHNRVLFETAFDLIAADAPNLFLIRSLRHDLSVVEQNYAGGPSKLLMKVCGKTPLTSVIAALLTIFVLSFVVILVLDSCRRLANFDSANLQQEFPLFFAIKDVPIGEYLLAIHAAFLGSIVSVIVRIQCFIYSVTFSPLLIYFSVLTKPFIAAMFAIMAYSVMKAGVVSFLGVDVSGPSAPYIAWVVGFLSGFSERSAQDFMSRARGAFGDNQPSGTRP